MRINWNNREKTFEVEFAQQFWASDLAVAKKAGFITTGPPAWKWFTQKVKPLNYLRKHRPDSGLTIMEDALKEYTRLNEDSERNAEIKKKLADAKKELVEQKIIAEESEPCPDIPDGQEFGYFHVEPRISEIRVGFVAPEWTGPYCIMCHGQVYMWEMNNPPVCIWCEIALDKEAKVA